MPELPEVETIVRGLRRSVVGKTIAAADVRLARIAVAPRGVEFAPALAGSRIVATRRRGKYAVIELDSGRSLVVSLRMTGPARRDLKRGPRSTRARTSCCTSWTALGCISPTSGRLGECAWSSRGEAWDGGARPGTALQRLYTRGLYRYAGGADEVDQGVLARSAAHRRHRQHLCLRGPLGGSDPSEPAGGALTRAAACRLHDSHR
jgi:hypothetical protein